MPSYHVSALDPDSFTASAPLQLERFLDDHRSGMHDSLVGIPEAAEDSFVLADVDTISSIRDAYLAACADSREATRHLGLDDLVHGNRRGALPLRWVYFHLLRELAQHCGHADILREQILAAREGQAS